MAVPNISRLSQMQMVSFFKQVAPVTQEQCNGKAKSISGTPVTRTACQGGSSYTVDAGDVVVQFRVPSCPLDMALMKSVEQAYLDFTPRHKDWGLFHTTHVYTMNNVKGLCMYLARDHLQRNNYELLRTPIDSYARFVNTNAPAGLLSDPTLPNILRLGVLQHAWVDERTRSQAASPALLQLQRQRKELPERLHATLDALIPQLPSICDDSWPLAPDHTDLLENNIHVGPGHGRRRRGHLRLAGRRGWALRHVPGLARDHARVPDDERARLDLDLLPRPPGAARAVLGHVLLVPGADVQSVEVVRRGCEAGWLAFSWTTASCWTKMEI
ncbi:hypothetical protein F4859DRAFT_516383 [Xylaria cf. heliscus]|nr:hypothetical protein F4859DRAFT_516383 [Xylaria cf. heliscus]